MEKMVLMVEKLIAFLFYIKLSREKLGKQIGTSGAIISMYERSERSPSIEVSRKISIALNVSLDYLVGNTNQKLDSNVLNKVQEIQQLPTEDQNHLFYLINNVIQNVKTRLAFAK